MSAFIGTATPNNYYIGNTALSALYVGSNKIWPVGEEVGHFDFGNTASYPGSLLSITNISSNRNYVAGNLLSMSLYTTAATLDPSGSGLIARISASNPTYGNYIQPVAVASLPAANGNTFTFEIWVRPYTKKADGNTYLAGPDSTPLFSMYNQWYFGISNVNSNDASMVVVQANAGSTLSTIVSASTAPNAVDFNAWNHLVYTFRRNPGNVTTFTMYKNGVPQSIPKNNFTGGLTNSGQPFLSAGWITTLEFGLFDVSQWRFYNKVLDASEVLSLFQATRARYSI